MRVADWNLLSRCGGGRIQGHGAAVAARGGPLGSGGTRRHRLGEIEAGVRGATYDSPDEAYQLEKSLQVAIRQDPECVRAFLDTRLVLRTPQEVFDRPGLRDKVLELGSGWRGAPTLGPTREELLALVLTVS